MSKRNSLVLGLLFVGGAVSARAPYYPPSPRETPASVETPRSIFSSFRYRYKVAMEVELSRRVFAMLANDVQAAPEVMSHVIDHLEFDYAKDYLNPESFARLIRDNPDLARQMSAGLSTKSSIADQLKSQVEREQAERMAKFRESMLRPGGAVPLVPLIGVQPILQKRHAPLVGSTAKLEFKDQTLRLPDGTSMKDAAAIHIPIDSDWPRVNARWNALPFEVRKAQVHFELLDPHVKTEIYFTVFPNKFGLGFYSDVDFTAHAKDYLRPFVLRIDGLGRRHADGSALPEEEELASAAELKHREPETSATRYLEQLMAVVEKANLVDRIRNPLAQSLIDSSYHLNFSVAGRRESPDPVLRAWNHLTAIKMLDAGVTNVFEDKGYGMYRETLDTKVGFLRKKSHEYFEIREHFTDPETELSMIMRAFDLPNAEARRLIYGTFMPKIKTPVLKELYVQNKPLFYDLVLGTPELEVELSPELSRFVRGWQDVDLVFKKSFANPHVLAHKDRVKTLLGVHGTRRLKSKMASFVLLATLRSPKLLSYYREMLVEDVGCEGRFAVLCSPAARAVAISNVTLGSIEAVKSLVRAGRNAGVAAKRSCQSFLTGARTALGRWVPQ